MNCAQSIAAHPIEGIAGIGGIAGIAGMGGIEGMGGIGGIEGMGKSGPPVPSASKATTPPRWSRNNPLLKTPRCWPI
jgi:hypothetical protein